jgi:NAD(P)H-dependent flavin oxidoreductase YrpB (nitropropane dioxygenase family)
VVEGDVVYGEMSAGANSGMIEEIISAAEVVRQLVQEAETVMSRLNRIASFP